MSALLLAILAVVVITNRSAGASVANLTMTPEDLLISTNLQQRFATLGAAHTDVCANLGNKPAIMAAMQRLPDGNYLQGSCCDPMNMRHYAQQIAALKAYASDSNIPADPYNMSVAMAKRLLQDDQSIALTSAQQSEYDQAPGKTADHGWCCCQCWAWYAHSGLAKYLITARGFSAARVVAVINLEDCCGG